MIGISILLSNTENRKIPRWENLSNSISNTYPALMGFFFRIKVYLITNYCIYMREMGLYVFRLKMGRFLDWAIHKDNVNDVISYMTLSFHLEFNDLRVITSTISYFLIFIQIAFKNNVKTLFKCKNYTCWMSSFEYGNIVDTWNITWCSSNDVK